jgi:hypothetical protein
MSRLFFILLIVGVLTTLVLPSIGSAQAQTKVPKSSNEPKQLSLDAQYQQRFALYEKKIDQALASGSVSPAEALSFKTKVYRLSPFDLMDLLSTMPYKCQNFLL